MPQYFRTFTLIAAGIFAFLSGSPTPAVPAPAVTISRATTYITRPLDKDGLPDYVAALNREFARGVSVKKNAAIPILQLFVTTEYPNADKNKWALRELKLMHIAPSSKQLEPFASVDNYVFQHIPASQYTNTALKEMLRGSPEWNWINWPGSGKITSQSLRWAVSEEEIDAALEHPWTAKQCPLVFKYLQSQRKDLKIIIAASKLPQIYFPLVASHGFDTFSPVASIMYPLPLFLRQCEEMCVIKANFCLGKKDLNGCEKYLLATRRLIALSAVPPWGPARLIAANSITGYLVPGQRALLSYPGLTTSDALYYLHLMNASPITLPLSTLHRHFFRFLWLDYMITFYRRTAHIGPRPHYNLGSPPTVAIPLPPLLMHPPRGIRWNWQLRQINSLTSLYLLANQWKTPPFNLSRHSPRFAFIARLKHVKTQKVDPLIDPNRTFCDAFVSSLFPDPGRDVFRPLQVIALGKEVNRLDRIGFALAAYRAANGSYPATLSVLSPKYLNDVPKNLLTFKPPEYRHGVNGYVLIANKLGLNRHDSKHDLWMLRNQNLLLQMPVTPTAPIKDNLP